MNLVLVHNVERIYALAYDNGQLPSQDVFRNEYYDHLSSLLEENYLKYRYYDSISVDEETRKEEGVTVQIEIIYGSNRQIVAYGLKKDENVWKMDLYHLVEESKKGRE